MWSLGRVSDAAAGTQDLRFRVSGLCHLGLLYDLLGILGGGGMLGSAGVSYDGETSRVV